MVLAGETSSEKRLEMQVPPGERRAWRLVLRLTGKVWRKREPLSLRGHRRACAVARDGAPACTPNPGLFREPWGLPLSLLLISQPPLSMGSFGMELPPRRRGWLASGFACEATRCWANALYHQRASLTQYCSLKSIRWMCLWQQDS